MAMHEREQGARRPDGEPCNDGQRRGLYFTALNKASRRSGVPGMRSSFG